MDPLAAQSVDASLRGPVQGTAFSDMSPKSSSTDSPSAAGGSMGSQRAEALSTTSGNKIDAPSKGGLIEKPEEGAMSMDEMDSAMSRIAALLQKFEKAQDMVR